MHLFLQMLFSKILLPDPLSLLLCREICTGKKATTWSDLRKSIEPRHIETLKRVYKSVDDVDLYLGGFLEARHEDSILGPVFKCIIGDQFARLKKGDKFFYDLGVDSTRAFTLQQLEQIRLAKQKHPLFLTHKLSDKQAWRGLYVTTLMRSTESNLLPSRCRLAGKVCVTQ